MSSEKSKKKSKAKAKKAGKKKPVKSAPTILAAAVLVGAIVVMAGPVYSSREAIAKAAEAVAEETQKQAVVVEQFVSEALPDTHAANGERTALGDVIHSIEESVGGADDDSDG